MKKWAIIFAVISMNLWAQAPTNFPQAKRIAEKLFASNRQTLYCQCQFAQDKAVNLASCNMSQAQSIPRAERIEWEHMMPASYFGKDFACWREKLCVDKKGKRYKGRKCCEKIDPQFKQMEAELYNLWPADGLVNAKRSNYSYAQLYPVQNPKTHNFYGCPVVVDKVDHLFEPSDHSKGIVARAMLFMSSHHGIALDQEVENLMQYWHQKYPPSQREKQWGKQVAAVTGYANPFITYSVL